MPAPATIPYLASADVAALISMEDAIEVLRDAFGAPELPVSPVRTCVPVAAGDVLTMPSHGRPGVGIKVVTVARGNAARGIPVVNATYLLLDAETLEPRAILDGGTLTELRTAATSAVATAALARPDARRLVVFGAGVQAQAHIAAMQIVRDVESVVVVDPYGGAAALVDWARSRGLRADVGEATAVGEADLICTCTTSDVPVFDGRRLRPGAHVNAIGAYTPTAREVDAATVERARVVVEDREAALAEAGDLLLAIEEGRFSADAIVADLAEAVRGTETRRSSEDITLYESVGIAMEDLVVARAVFDRWGNSHEG